MQLPPEWIAQLQSLLALAQQSPEIVAAAAAALVVGVLAVAAALALARRRRRALRAEAPEAPPEIGPAAEEPLAPPAAVPREEPEPAARPVQPAPASAPEPAPPAPEPAPLRPGPPVAPPPEPRAPVAPAPAAPAPAPAPAIVAEPAPPAAPPPPPQPRSLRDRLARTRDALVGRLEGLLGGRRVDGAVLEDLELLLFGADLGVKTAEGLLEVVRRKAAGADADGVRAVLRAEILSKLRRIEPPPGEALGARGRPHVILVLGVNGSGKTTTIGKLAARYVAAGKKVVLGAGDTFRAAAIEQLQAWGQRAGCEVIAGIPGGDPSAVAFDTLKAAVARGADVAIIDTAGRLQTKAPLIEELKKIVRVIDREVPGAPHESLLVLDSNTGQNAISQARIFTDAARVTALALTKLDGTAKGGVIVGLADELGIPVKYVGVGEGVEDLRDFVADEFVRALFGEDGEAR